MKIVNANKSEKVLTLRFIDGSNVEQTYELEFRGENFESYTRLLVKKLTDADLAEPDPKKKLSRQIAIVRSDENRGIVTIKGAPWSEEEEKATPEEGDDFFNRMHRMLGK
jgi:hypothetical protein